MRERDKLNGPPHPLAKGRPSAESGHARVTNTPSPHSNDATSDEENSNAVVAAYEAGRLWNQLLWSTSITWLGLVQESYDEAESLFRRLGLKLQQTAKTAAARGPLREVMRQSEQFWRNQYSLESRKDELWKARSDLCKQVGSNADFMNLRERKCEALVKENYEILNSTKDRIHNGFDDLQIKAWDFGVLVDEAPCPPCVYRHLYDSTKTTPASLPSNGADMTENAEPNDTVNYLCNWQPKPGDLEPKGSWFDEVRLHSTELGIQEALPAIFALFANREKVKPKDVVQQLDDAVRRALTTQWLLAPKRKEKATTPRAKNVNEARDRWIYEQCKGTLTYNQIIAELDRMRKKKPWRKISTIQGIRHVARAYAARHDLPLPPPRQDL
jgi:hypothetical protein